MGSTGRGGGAGGAGGGGGVTALLFSGGSPRYLVDSLLFSDMFDEQSNKLQLQRYQVLPWVGRQPILWRQKAPRGCSL